VLVGLGAASIFALLIGGAKVMLRPPDEPVALGWGWLAGGLGLAAWILLLRPGAPGRRTGGRPTRG
jgi:hypothetical protein